MITIETEAMNHHFIKHHIKGLPFNASLNQFIAPDTGNIAHCHPYDFRTIMIENGYTERVFQISRDGLDWMCTDYFRAPGTVQEVKAETIHQIIGLPDGEAWTLFQPHSGHKRTSREYKFTTEGVYTKAWNESEFKPYKP